MSPQVRPLRGSRAPRPWLVPPALTHRPDGQLRGREILAEFQEPFATTLFLMLRDVELWAATPAGRRGRLFKLPALQAWSATQLPDALAEARQRLMEALTGGDANEARTAASACTRIAEWSAAKGSRTALLFAEAAAQLDPTSAALARNVARHALRCSISGADWWLSRASALARRGKDWTLLAHTTIDLADLYAGLGDRTGTRAALLRARRLSLRHKLGPEVRARTEIAMLRLMLVDAAAAEVVGDQIRRVLRTYPVDQEPESTDLRILLVETLIEGRRPEDALQVARCYPFGTPEGNDRLATLERRAAEAQPHSANGSGTAPAGV